MNTRQFVLRETGMLAIGQAVCAGVTVGVFALLGYYSTAVFLGAMIGTVLSVGNFFLMAVAAEAASDKAMNDDVKGGKAILKTSQNARLFGIFLLILLLARSGVCNAVAMVIPLVLARPILMIVEFFRKVGEDKK